MVPEPLLQFLLDRANRSRRRSVSTLPSTLPVSGKFHVTRATSIWTGHSSAC